MSRYELLKGRRREPRAFIIFIISIGVGLEGLGPLLLKLLYGILHGLERPPEFGSGFAFVHSAFTVEEGVLGGIGVVADAFDAFREAGAVLLG